MALVGEKNKKRVITFKYLQKTTVYKVANACDNVVDTKTHTRINHRKMSHVRYKKDFVVIQ